VGVGRVASPAAWREPRSRQRSGTSASSGASCGAAGARETRSTRA